MSSEEKFKELLKAKLEAKEFPFKAGNWEKAQQMIDASRNKKKRRALFVLLGLLLLTSGFIFLYPFANTTATVVSAKTPVTAPVTGPATSKPAEDAKNNLSATYQSAAREPAKTEIAAAGSAPGKQSAAKSADKQAVAPQAARQNMVAKANPVPAVGVNKGAMAVAINRKKSTEQAPTNNAMAKVPGEAENNITPKTVPPLAATTKEHTTNNAAGISGSGDNDKNEGMAPEPARPAQNETAAEAEKPADTNTMVAAAMPTVPIATPSLAAKDSVAAVASAPVNTPGIEGRILPKNIFSIEAGTNYLLGWKAQGKQDANGFNPVIGISYMSFISPKIAISAGLQYTSVGNMKQYTHVSKISRYGLGEESYVTKITPLKIHYLQLPLKINFVLNDKNTFGAGYIFAYLLTVDNKLETYNERLNSSTDYKTSKTKGYVQGFNNFDSQLSLFYRRAVYHNLFINAEFICGVTDVKNNTFFASSTFERNLGLKLTLVYNLFKK